MNDFIVVLDTSGHISLPDIALLSGDIEDNHSCTPASVSVTVWSYIRHLPSSSTEARNT